jgi:transposase
MRRSTACNAMPESWPASREQAVHYILGPFGQDCALLRFGLRLAKCGGKSGKKRAVMAMAHKLAVVLHHLWASERTMNEPLRRAAA